MSSSNETAYVKTQYATSSNLDARIALHQDYSTATQPFHDWLFDHVTLPLNARVFEVGCGSGALWSQVYSRIPRDWHLTLSDYSFGMASQARANLQRTTLDPHFLQTDIQSLPIPSNTFDAVFANHMLYHVPDLDRGLAEIRRVLKPGGTFYAATNGLAHLRELAELVAELTGQPVTTDTPEPLFGLENGGAILSRHFANVTRDIQENNLRVTAVEPLVAYIGSGMLYTPAGQDETYEQNFRARVRREIDTNGAFHITKSVGLYIAS